MSDHYCSYVHIIKSKIFLLIKMVILYCLHDRLAFVSLYLITSCVLMRADVIFIVLSSTDKWKDDYEF